MVVTCASVVLKPKMLAIAELVIEFTLRELPPASTFSLIALAIALTAAERASVPAVAPPAATAAAACIVVNKVCWIVKTCWPSCALPDDIAPTGSNVLKSGTPSISSCALS